MLFLVFGLFVLLYSSYVACIPHDNLFLNTQTFPWLCLFCVLCLRRMELLLPPVAILSIHLTPTPRNAPPCSTSQKGPLCPLCSHGILSFLYLLVITFHHSCIQCTVPGYVLPCVMRPAY